MFLLSLVEKMGSGVIQKCWPVHLFWTCFRGWRGRKRGSHNATPCKNDLSALSVGSSPVSSLCRPWRGTNDRQRLGRGSREVFGWLASCSLDFRPLCSRALGKLLCLWEVYPPICTLASSSGFKCFQAGTVLYNKQICWGNPMFYRFIYFFYWEGNNEPTSLYCLDIKCFVRIWKPQVKPSIPKGSSMNNFS